jgi:hypothetical protein
MDTAVVEFLFILQKWVLAAGFVGSIVVITLLLAGWKLR